MTKLNNTLQNNPVSNQVLSSSQDGYVLSWDNADGYWKGNPEVVYYDIYPAYDTVSNNYVSNNIIFTKKIYPLMNITIHPYYTGTFTDIFTGGIIFPKGEPFVATICYKNCSLQAYLTSNSGGSASILAPTDGYSQFSGYIQISGMNGITTLSGGTSITDSGVYEIVIAGSGGTNGISGGVAENHYNNTIYGVYNAAIINSSSINIVSNIQDNISVYPQTILAGVNFTNGSTDITGSGFLTNFSAGQYIKNYFDPNSNFTQISSVNSDTDLTLLSAYPGTSGSSSAVISDGYTAYNDYNNGNLKWAFLTYADSLNSVSLNSSSTLSVISCDGYNISGSSPLPQTYYSESSITVNDGFNYEDNLFSNLFYFYFETGSLTAPFTVGIPPQGIISTITNQTSFTCTFGYSSDGSTLTGTTINILAGQTVGICGDGINILSTTNNVLPNVHLTSPTSSIYQMIEPSGTTYLVDATDTSVSFYLPINPVDGQTFTLKDSNSASNGWLNNGVAISSISSDSIEYPYNYNSSYDITSAPNSSNTLFTPGIIAPGGDTVSFNTNGNSITYIYSLNGATWFVKDQLLPD